MKKILSIVAVTVCAAQALYCSASTLQSLKLLADTESVSVAPVAEPEVRNIFPEAADLAGASGGLAAIVEGAHQVGAVISGLASYVSDTESNKTDYKGEFMSGGKAVNSMISAAERRAAVVGLQLYSNQKPEGRVYSYLVFWKGAGF